MRTVQEIFDIAIHLMDEQNESTGGTMTSDTKEYALRTPNALNSILNWAYPASDTYRPRDDGKRPTYPKVEALTDKIDMDDTICLSVLPYGLAARLAEENSILKDYWEQTFLERLQAARNSLPSTAEPVEDVYGGFGGIEYGRFSRW